MGSGLAWSVRGYVGMAGYFCVIIYDRRYEHAGFLKSCLVEKDIYLNL